MNTNIIDVNIDDYNIVQLAKKVLGVEEKAAAAAILEIGIFNILNYPTGHQKIDNILSGGKFPELITEIKKVYCL